MVCPHSMFPLCAHIGTLQMHIVALHALSLLLIRDTNDTSAASTAELIQTHVTGFRDLNNQMFSGNAMSGFESTLSLDNDEVRVTVNLHRWLFALLNAQCGRCTVYGYVTAAYANRTDV